MPALTIDTQAKADVIALALFNYKPTFRGQSTLKPDAEQAQQELLDDITDIIQNWYVLVRDEMHPEVTLVGGKVPAHKPGAFPKLSCCGGLKEIVNNVCTCESCVENGSD